VWNFFFIPPRFTLVISSFDDAMMVLTFFLTALVGGLLTSRIKRQESILQVREERSRVLYELVQRLASAPTLSEIAAVVISTIDGLFGGSSSLYLADIDGTINWKRVYGPTPSDANGLRLPLRGSSGELGVLVFTPSPHQTHLPLEKEKFLEMLLAQAAIALERFQFAEQAQNAKLYEASEILHQTLLNSVSHELRTPITALIGSSSALRDERTFSDPKARAGLIDELVHSAQRLDRVVENLLDLSRLQKEGLQLKREWFDLSEVVRATLSDLRNEIGARSILVHGEDSIYFEGDFQLLSHALNQLFFNAIKHSPSDSPIEIAVQREAGGAQIAISDRGSGIPVGLESRIFEKFFRAPGSPTGGLGLGLTIASNIVELHGGRIRAENRRDGTGATFTVRLPLKEVPRELEEALQ
jgi:two-component system sensor histidine kinase KdpD